MQIHQLKLRLSNAYVLLGRRPILVDTGTASDGHAIRVGLRKLHIELQELALILHTHVHSDHVGATAELAAAARCPIAYHLADQPIVDRGHNGRLNGIGLGGMILSRVFHNAKFNSIQADVALVDGMQLDEFGCEAMILETPGHTAGSISVVTSTGDAIIGDVIMGGIWGGMLWPARPKCHYFADDLQQTLSSIDKILSCTSRTLYVGHGGPLTHTRVKDWRSRGS